jgi:GNAT superfamily N-acetyltransferase
MQDSSDKVRFLLGHLHHMTLEGHPDIEMPQADEPQAEDAYSDTHEKVNLNFSMHWRYNQSDDQYTTNPDYEGIIAEADIVFQKCRMESDTLKDIHYGKHTDRAYLAFYKVPQFGICIGRLPDGSPCCAAIIRIVDGKCLSKSASRDITVAELSSISASPQGHGYGTQLMNYVQEILKDMVDAIELKINTKHVDQEKYMSLGLFYKKFGFMAHRQCQCDSCRLIPEDKREHIQMVNKIRQGLVGTVVLSTDVAYEIIDNVAYERGGGWRACDVYSRPYHIEEK